MICDPLAPLTPAFWLSFIAVWVLLTHGFTAKKGFGGVLQSFLKIQWHISLALLPLSFLFFHQFAYLGCVANLFAIPWVSYGVMPLLLPSRLLYVLHMEALSRLFLHYAVCSMQTLWYGLNSLAHVPFAASGLHYLSLLSFACMGSVWLLISPIRSTLLRQGLLWSTWLGLLYWPSAPKPPVQRACRLTLLDVGQGLATVIQTHRHTCIVDTGPQYRGGFDSARRIILPYLSYAGIHHLDRLVISHGDNDHAGGARTLQRAFPEAEVIDNADKRLNRLFRQEWHRLKRMYPHRVKGKHVYCSHHLQWQWDGVRFAFLTVPKTVVKSINDQACVLRISVGQKHILLPADIERSAESYLLTHQANRLLATVLLAPHHGSKSSSTWPFVKRVAPHNVIFSTGWHNRYHFPHSTVVKRYRTIGAALRNTATCGACQLTLRPATPLHRDQPLLLKCNREEHLHFWSSDFLS